MEELTVHKSEKAKRTAHKVVNINPKKNIFSSLRSIEEDGKRKYAVSLCISNVTKVTIFPTYIGALREMDRYKALYKPAKNSI